MKMSRIIEELERQDITPTYANIAIYATFVSQEGLIEQIGLDRDNSSEHNTQHLDWLQTLFS